MPRPIENIIQDLLSDLNTLTPGKIRMYVDEAFSAYQEIKEKNKSNPLNK